MNNLIDFLPVDKHIVRILPAAVLILFAVKKRFEFITNWITRLINVIVHRFEYVRLILVHIRNVLFGLGIHF